MDVALDPGEGDLGRGWLWEAYEEFQPQAFAHHSA